MNSARDRAENIIDELQEFLNRQHSKDDTLSDLDLSISHSSSRTGAQTPVANGDGADLDVARWDSFSFSQTVTSSSRKEEEDEAGWGQDGGGTLGDQSKMAGSSEVLMSSSGENHQLPNGGSDGENVTLESYDFLEPAPPPPPPKEFRDSTVMPFPMIFRRSKKDPGSKQYNELVKELEQVLEKRNDIRRSKSMRDDADIPETVGSLRASRKMSSSMDNLSVFANKALLSKLESHLKNRGSPGSAVHPGSEKSSPESDEPDITAKFGVVLKSPESFSQDMSFGSEEEFPSSVGPYGFSTLPNMGHYKKNHQHVTGRSNHLHSHSHSQSHLHRSSFSPDVMYRSQTLDSNLRHITRISVSKSMDSLPGSRSNQSNHSSSSSSPPPHHQSQDLSHRWTLDRQGSVPMKTIVEHFNETDPEDIPAWNAALKNSKKHKERGVHRSISQRMVQKIFRVIRPSSKSNASAPVSRSSSFSPASRHVQNTPQARADDSHVQRNSTSRISGADDLVVELPSQQKVSVVPISDARGVRSESRSVGNEVRHTHVQQDTQDGRLTVELPNKHIAAIVPVSSHTTQNIDGWTHTTTASTPGQIVSRSRTSTVQRGSNHNSSDNSLTVELPNHHRANIVPTLPRTSTSNTANSVNRLGFPQGGNPNVKLVRSASAASAYRQTYRPAEKGPNSIAKCSIDPQMDGQYAVTYVPVEVGMFDVQVKWNGKEIHGSPFHPKVVCARKVQVVGGWQHYMDAKERVHLVVNEEKQIPFETSEAGPGKMTAEVKSPSGLIPVTVDDSVVGRSTVIFTPREEGMHYIHLYWSDTPLVSSPFQGYATSGVADPSKVILTGRGLKEAIVREEAEFMIDASQAGQGEPEVQLTGVRAEVNVFVTPLGGGKFRCTYIPVVPGAYLLHITWNGRQLRGSPYKVNVIGAFYPNKVMVSGEGLKGGLLGRDLEVRIDTRKAGPGSPFAFKVSAQPDASKVRVSGPGVEHGILATFQSRFVVETRGAGAGQLTVRIRGPKGAFQVEMYRDSQKDRTILCRYDPCETGLYIISAELEQVLQEQSFHNASFHSRASGYQWRDEF
nr:hypothetical protein BaRGS_007580 [Batillaria attramentaria]